MVGETEESLQGEGRRLRGRAAPLPANARGQIIGDETGFLKLLFRRDDMKLLGVHVIGEQATELVHIGLVAMLAGSGCGALRRGLLQLPDAGRPVQDATYDALRSGRV